MIVLIEGIDSITGHPVVMKVDCLHDIQVYGSRNIIPRRTNQGVWYEEVYSAGYDTAGNYRWTGTLSGYHVWRASDGRIN